MAANKSRNGQSKPAETGTQTDPKSEQSSNPDAETKTPTDPNPDTNPDEQTNPNPDEETPPPEPGETVTALALVDHGPFNLRCGFVCRVPAEAAEQLEADGVIDTSEKAVATGKRPAAEEGNK